MTKAFYISKDRAKNLRGSFPSFLLIRVKIDDRPCSAILPRKFNSGDDVIFADEESGMPAATIKVYRSGVPDGGEVFDLKTERECSLEIISPQPLTLP